MDNSQLSLYSNFIQKSNFYTILKNAFSMINSGHAKEAKKQYPYEFFFINKYCPSSIEELTQLVSKKLELH